MSAPKKSVGAKMMNKRERIERIPVYKSHIAPSKRIQEKAKTHQPIVFHDVDLLLQHLNLTDGMTFSFHHHLRSGDQVVNLIVDAIGRTKLRHCSLAPSSIFPNYTAIAALISQGRVDDVITNYLNGPVADVIDEGKLNGLLFMHTHGGRARAIETGELPIDVAFLATPAVDQKGNGSGAQGKNACGTIGYAQSDLRYAKRVVIVTDTVLDSLEHIDFPGEYVDCILVVDSIGEAGGIVSGTTKLTRDPVGLKIAADTVKLLHELGMIKPGMSMQTGAGGISLAVTEFVRRKMVEQRIRGSFASGGITKAYVDMLEQGLFERLHDVQCFDLDAAASYRRNVNHLAMSASEYGNPSHPSPIVDQLDFVVLGATEIDLNFNTNVTTDSFGKIIGGSGGHADTAAGAKVAIITTQLIKSRLPIIRERVLTTTTPGDDIDILVTERGIAINPRRRDLIELLKRSSLDIVSIETLYRRAIERTGVPRSLPRTDDPIGVVVYRDGTRIDTLYRTKR
ncbi:MAG: citrate lyase subunit alpha [Bacillus subtilis]|nr:citrate lyase subunit alpha [Bacillus subtilis]